MTTKGTDLWPIDFENFLNQLLLVFMVQMSEPIYCL